MEDMQREIIALQTHALDAVIPLHEVKIDP